MPDSILIAEDAAGGVLTLLKLTLYNLQNMAGS